MQSKNKRAPTRLEREWIAMLADQPCAVCGAASPSEAHHVRQHAQYLCIPLCADCHRGALLGLHGQKRAWTIRKMDELDALNETIRKLEA